MRSAALKTGYNQNDFIDDFTADLEDGTKFRAWYTELRSDTTPGRGDVYIVIAYDREKPFVRTFTIVFEKSKLEASTAITEFDVGANVTYNSYENQQAPTLQKATSGTLDYKLDMETDRFTGTFTADVAKSDASGTFPCTATFDTSLT
ncbi:hypothetical protein GRW89_23045 [Pseudomonas moraviensis]|jgi:hypothetical protein|uniref:hypothetical protein n=1 Tax=Pseudomonas TaxID=286 RepID=UPI000F7712FB|nr:MULTISPECIES: hypothetical protein [Pseudomonas]MBH3443198.1 hypothetical protein [Pseudomonas moraviensis]MXI49393.1 hypothetical protein [Pseudomonas moraviensis]RRW54515.1 hypothetical protein EGJ55_14700 [Pseudomonas moraviensis]